MSEATPEPRAVVRRTRRWSSVWIVPLVALTLAGWLVWHHALGRGALIHVRFQTADGLQPEKTEVRCRSVRIGNVEALTLSKDLRSVIISLRIERKAEDLVREGSRFWVVRPRVSASDISGLGTLITGVYVELDPGEGQKGGDSFVGLEQPPVTNSSIPGLRLVLTADTAGSLNVGSPIYFKGFEVGRVELRSFDVKEKHTRFDVFIPQEYASLVTEGTRFWNTSGVDVEAGAEGLHVRTPSFQAMLSGGASFDVPPDGVPGKPVVSGATFSLFPDQAASRQSLISFSSRYLLLFNQSVRGLQKGAPVEFRGIPLGRVADISVKYAPPGDQRIPVLIEIDPSVLPSGAKNEGEDAILADAVKHGLRAKLSTSSLLTGALFVDLDFVEKAPPAEVGKLNGLDTLPTESSGLVQMEAKVKAILDKIDGLPLQDLIEKYRDAAVQITGTSKKADAAIDDAHRLLSQEDTQRLGKDLERTLESIRVSSASFGPSSALQGDVRRSLDELRAALRAFHDLSQTVGDKPNSLIFGKESSGNPIPHAHRN